MGNIFSFFLLAAVAAFSLACWTGSAENEADVNSNAQANQPANVEQTNVNALPEDVPKYDDAQVAFTEGNRFLDANETQKAIEAYRQAVELDPDLADAHFRLGVAYALVERETEVEPEEEETPEDGKNKKKKKEEEKKTNSQKAFENAIKAYEKILKKDKENAHAYYNMGRAYSKLDEDQDALKALQKAVKIDPENSEYQTELGEIYIKLAEYDLAIRALKKALEIDENNLPAEDLLEKAEAGKKRVDFGANQIKPRLQTDQTQPETRKSTRSKPQPSEPAGPPPAAPPTP